VKMFVRRMLTNAKVLDQGITRLINQADKSGDGAITFEELIAYLSSRGCAMESDHKFVKEWMDEVDFYGDGVLDFHEIKMWGIARLGVRGDIRACLQVADSLDEGLEAYMAAVDDTGNKTLTADNVKTHSTYYGTAASIAEIERFIKDADTTGDGTVSWDELRSYCLKNMGVAMFTKRMLNNGKDIQQGVERLFVLGGGSETGCTKDNFINMLRKRGVALADDCKYAEEWFLQVDEDSSGDLGRDEIKAWADKWVGVAGEIRSHKGDGSIEDGVKAYLEAADLIGNGNLCKEEIIKYSAWKGTAVNQEQVDALFEVADSNKDGCLTYEELLAYAQQALSDTPVATE